MKLYLLFFLLTTFITIAKPTKGGPKSEKAVDDIKTRQTYETCIHLGIRYRYFNRYNVESCVDRVGSLLEKITQPDVVQVLSECVLAGSSREKSLQAAIELLPNRWNSALIEGVVAGVSTNRNLDHLTMKEITSFLKEDKSFDWRPILSNAFFMSKFNFYGVLDTIMDHRPGITYYIGLYHTWLSTRGKGACETEIVMDLFIFFLEHDGAVKLKRDENYFYGIFTIVCDQHEYGWEPESLTLFLSQKRLQRAKEADIKAILQHAKKHLHAMQKKKKNYNLNLWGWGEILDEIEECQQKEECLALTIETIGYASKVGIAPAILRKVRIRAEELPQVGKLLVFGAIKHLREICKHLKYKFSAQDDYKLAEFIVGATIYINRRGTHKTDRLERLTQLVQWVQRKKKDHTSFEENDRLLNEILRMNAWYSSWLQHTPLVF